MNYYRVKSKLKLSLWLQFLVLFFLIDFGRYLSRLSKGKNFSSFIEILVEKNQK